MIPSPLSQFEGLKVVVFAEAEALSDRFEQIMFSPENFKKMTAAVESLMKPHPEGGFILVTNPDETYNFPNIKDIYTEEESKPDA